VTTIRADPKSLAIYFLALLWLAGAAIVSYFLYHSVKDRDKDVVIFLASSPSLLIAPPLAECCMFCHFVPSN
jgi:hypothetical protein